MSHAFNLAARLLVSIFALLGLASCSGGVSGSAPVSDPSRITILPATATLYAGVPTTFVISGGTGAYIVSSSNQTVVPVAGAINGNTLIVTPNEVGADTAVTLTVRDTGTTPISSAALTVRPGTVNNDITVAPSSTQGLNCAPAVCSGGDALVSTTLSQAGVPLAGRSVRFDAISGDFRFVTSTAGSTIETLATTVTIPTDQSGRATARIRVTAGAANQTALMQVTDVSTGSFQRTSFVISQATGTSPGFFATPSSITFQGRRQGECAGSDLSAIFYVFGGTAPYVISNTISTLLVRPDVVTSSGSGFTVTPNGACIGLPGVPITIRDAAGRTTSVSVANIPGTDAVPALAASPGTVTLSSCDATANVQVAGGRSGTYFVASGSDSLVATISGSTVTIRRRNPSGTPSPTGSIGISDGTSVVNVAVTLSGAALGACPSPGFTGTPSTVTLTDCTTTAQVILSGGSGTYTAASDNGAVTVSITGNVLSIKRATPSGAFTTATVTVSDGRTSIPITVNGTGAGAGTCGTGGALSATPTTVNLSDCSSAAFVSLSGASGTLSAASSSPSVSATVSGSLVTIRRTSPSSAFGGGTVVVSDSASSVTITVSASGAGAGACSSPSPSITANPASVTLTDCSGVVQTTLSGGTGNYSAAASSGSITASVSGNILSVRRTNPSSAFTGGSVTVSDGTSATSVPVNVSGAGGGACPTPASPVSVSPSTVTLTDCSGSVQVAVSGGSGTYSAASSSSGVTASVSGNIVTIRRANPSTAVSGATVTITDGTTSANVTVTATGQGAGSCPTPAPAITVSPSSLTLTDCDGVVQATVSGGTGSYSAASSSGSVIASISGSVLSVRRANPSSAFSGATVTVSDGTSSTDVTVNATGTGAGSCPTPVGGFSATPTTVNLTDCSGTAQVNLSGGSGTYTASSDSGSIVATLSGSVVSIRRAVPSAATNGGTVRVSDGVSTINIAVTTSGTGAGACSSPINATPSSIQLTDCLGAVEVTLSGGNGSYIANSNTFSVVVTAISANRISIRRRSPSAAFAPPATVAVTDTSGSPNTNITVEATPAGAAACP